jgi:hypothetical protein
LSPRSLTFFDVIFSMIVLSPGQNLHQSSAGRAARAPAKAPVASVGSLRCCVLLALFLCGVAACPFRFLWALSFTPWSSDKALTTSRYSLQLVLLRSENPCHRDSAIRASVTPCLAARARRQTPSRIFSTAFRSTSATSVGVSRRGLESLDRSAMPREVSGMGYMLRTTTLPNFPVVFHFHLRHAAFSQFKSSEDKFLDKTAVLRITLNLDGALITSKSHTHPSYSETSRLLTSSLSLGVPVPRATQYIRDV